MTEEIRRQAIILLLLLILIITCEWSIRKLEDQVDRLLAREKKKSDLIADIIAELLNMSDYYSKLKSVIEMYKEFNSRSESLCELERKATWMEDRTELLGRKIALQQTNIDAITDGLKHYGERLKKLEERDVEKC